MNHHLFDTYANTGSSTDRSVIDLKGMPIPDIVETLNYDDILNDMFKDLVAKAPYLGNITASDPVYKILEVCAYRETLLRARVNNSVRAMLLVTAKGKDLDNIAANFNIKRKVVAADPKHKPHPIIGSVESDEDLRRRVQLSFDGFTTAGSEASYLFHALSSDDNVKDAYVRTGEDKAGKILEGQVDVFILTRDGAEPPTLLKKVADYLSADIRRPLTDKVNLYFVEQVPITGGVEAVLHLFKGVATDGIKKRAEGNLLTYINETQKVGREVAISGIYKALHVAGVERVELKHPTADTPIKKHQVAVLKKNEIKISLATTKP